MSKQKESSDESVGENSTDLIASWSDIEEHMLKGISERSNCMRWLHNECSMYFDTLNFYFTIPNIIISTLNGSFTMSLTALFPEASAQKSATTVIGLISIFSAVLITMNQYIKSQQMTEAHRSAALAYGKLSRMIVNELSMRRDQRTNGVDFIKNVRVEIDRLENTSPTILQFIIKKFIIQFSDKEIEKPEITGDIDEVSINREIHRRKKHESFYNYMFAKHKITDIKKEDVTVYVENKEDNKL